MKHAVFAALLLGLAACGHGSRAKTPSSAVAADDHWFADLVDQGRDLTLSIRPGVLSHDAVYGPLVRKAVRMAAAERKVTLGNTTLEAVEQADEILIAVRSSEPLDAVVVVSGVPAGIDAERVVDDEGKSPWHGSSRTPNGLTEILVREADPPTVLYVIGQRTWVFGAGLAARRVRERLGLRVTRPGPVPVTTDAVASIHVRGELLDRLRGIAKSGLRPMVDRLTEVALSLSQGTQGTLSASLVYEDDHAALVAEGRAGQLLAILPDKISPRLAFLKNAAIKRAGRTVAVTAVLPPEVLARLAHDSEGG